VRSAQTGDVWRILTEPGAQAIEWRWKLSWMSVYRTDSGGAGELKNTDTRQRDKLIPSMGS